MSTPNKTIGSAASKGLDLLQRYNCGPVKFSGNDNALYERHLTFDQVIPVEAATLRDKFEAGALSIRDVLSQRWIKTEQTYQERNAKRVYYLSMEFLLGRALANNIANLRIDPEAQQFARHHLHDVAGKAAPQEKRHQASARHHAIHS